MKHPRDFQVHKQLRTSTMLDYEAAQTIPINEVPMTNSFLQVSMKLYTSTTLKLVQILLSLHHTRPLFKGLKKGFSREESEAMLRKSVEIACDARDVYTENCSKSSCEGAGDGEILKNRPILVATSVGSYGAYLADGSEYSGNYGEAITVEVLKDFHRRRIQVLPESGADLIAFETVPNKIEAQAYAEHLEEEDIKIPTWFSFNSKDGVNVVSGDSLLDCASIAESCKKVVAVGINCTPPRFILGLILAIKKVQYCSLP
ncbi:hypothetical protein SLEP1_g55385 [Rubroshorea leprosula]|uniref:Hcy-binding domain-containing protein n=1 Tax=Rubroshorea leprosula TaxID=152421 RepID=A0AAV5MGC3_9ROSI|nr:hypothetical protein SLEP1_g55385 [Rubroshorea leprosula]